MEAAQALARGHEGQAARQGVYVLGRNARHVEGRRGEHAIALHALAEPPVRDLAQDGDAPLPPRREQHAFDGGVHELVVPAWVG